MSVLREALQPLRKFNTSGASRGAGFRTLPHPGFDTLARKYSDRPAVVDRLGQVTYGQLDARVHRLARQLREHGVGPETIVGVSVPRRIEMLVAVLATLRAGGAFLPLDPTYPVTRRQFMVEDSGTNLILTTSDLPSDLDLPGVMLMPIDPDSREDDGSGELAHLWPAYDPTNLAYVMYTSGSTGNPKGVMIERRNVAAFIRSSLRTFSAGELARTAAATSLSFDLCMFELLPPLWCGGAVVVVDNLFDLRSDQGAGITFVATVPSLMKAFLAQGSLPPTVRTVCLIGEALTQDLVDQLYRESSVRRVVNAYGPTEDTVYSTYADVRPGAPPPIGHPVRGTQAYILDDDLQPVAPGEPGELFLAGQGLARGYLGKTQLTRERFLESPLVPAPGERIYKTGDLARMDRDGTLHYLGRLDDQVKVRGVRIEPGEVEAALIRHPAVAQVAVIAQQPEDDGTPLLTAYFVSEPGHSATPHDLREFLREQLPEPLVPTIYVLLTELPLTANGKLDRKRLRRPEQARKAPFPLTRTEDLLGRLWMKTLALRHAPNAEDDFFQLGGDSLRAFELFDLIADEFGCELAPSLLLEASTLRALAAEIDAGVAGRPSIIVLNREGRLPPCVFVHAGAGTMLTLRSFGPAFDRDRPFYAMQAFSDRIAATDSMPGVREAAAACLRHLRKVQAHGPYLLAGFSIGGHVAFEMACTLQAEGGAVSFLGLVDPPAPHTLRAAGRAFAAVKEFTGSGPEPRRPDLFRRVASIASETLRDFSPRTRPAVSGPALSPWGAKWVAELEKREKQFRPRRYRGDVTVYTTAETTRRTGERDLGWSRYVEGPVRCVRISGDHSSMLLAPNVSVLASEMASDIDKPGIRAA